MKTPGSGRKAGTPNRATKELRTLLDGLAKDPNGVDLHAQRLHQLTQSKDEQVAVKALTTVLAYRFGKPVEHHEIGGEGGGPVRVEFVIVPSAA